MKVICKALGPVQANCYLVIQDGHAIIIDPGAEYPDLDTVLKDNGCSLDAVVLTHAHFDHFGGVDAIVSKYGVDVYLNPSEFEFLTNVNLNASANFYQDVVSYVYCKPLANGINEISNFKIKAMYCPGHSIGSTVLIIDDLMFSGDVIFQASIGRMDLATGSQSMMMESLKKIAKLDKNYTIYPGHGPDTTLENEKRWNYELKYAESL